MNMKFKKFLISIGLAASVLSAHAFDFLNQNLINRSGKLIITNNTILNTDYTNVTYLDNNGTSILYSLQTNVNNANITAPAVFRFAGLWTDANGQPAPFKLTCVCTPYTNGTRADLVLATNIMAVTVQSGIIRSNAAGASTFLGGVATTYSFPVSNGLTIFTFPLFTNLVYGANTIKVIAVTNNGVGTAPLGTNWQCEFILSGWRP